MPSDPPELAQDTRGNAIGYLCLECYTVADFDGNKIEEVV